MAESVPQNFSFYNPHNINSSVITDYASSLNSLLLLKAKRQNNMKTVHMITMQTDPSRCEDTLLDRTRFLKVRGAGGVKNVVFTTGFIRAI